MFNNVGFLGGDLRNIRLIELFLKDNIKVSTCYINSNIINENLISYTDLNIFLESTNYIISGVPFSKDGIFLNAPFIDKKIEINHILDKIYDKTLVAGKINNEIKDKLLKQNTKVIDLMESGKLTLYNAMATVEGAIEIMIKNTEKTLFKSNILILGYGRIGKILADRLKNFGANIYCEARKDEDLVWIDINNFNRIDINELDVFLGNNKIDIIVNTIPHLILDKNRLNLLNSDIFILDLASKPGGVDFQYAKEKNLKFEWALGLPGKVAPVSVAEFIKKELPIGTEDFDNF